MLAGHVTQARQLLCLILGGKRLTFTPTRDQRYEGWVFTGQALLDTLLSGICVTGSYGADYELRKKMIETIETIVLQRD